MVDVAWYVYKHRLQLAGYPMGLLNPEVDTWFLTLHASPAFANGLAIT